jgi:hypothetical protein
MPYILLRPAYGLDKLISHLGVCHYITKTHLGGQDTLHIANEDGDGGGDGGGGEVDATFSSEYCEDEIISCGRSVQLLAIRANFCIRAIKAWDSKTYRRIYRAPRARRQCRANFRIRAINAALLRAGTPRDPTKLDIVWRRPALRTSR